jgi:hypothetical protein
VGGVRKVTREQGQQDARNEYWSPSMVTEIGTIGASAPSRATIPSRRSLTIAPIGSPTVKSLNEFIRFGSTTTTSARDSGISVVPAPSDGWPKAHRRSSRTSVTVPPDARVTSPSTMTAATIEPGAISWEGFEMAPPPPVAATQPMRSQLSASQPPSNGACHPETTSGRGVAAADLLGRSQSTTSSPSSPSAAAASISSMGGRFTMPAGGCGRSTSSMRENGVTPPIGSVAKAHP